MENEGILALPPIKITCRWFWNPFHLSPRDGPRTMALCVGVFCCQQEETREEGSARQWERTLGSPALLLDIIQKSPLSVGSPERKTNRARNRGKCWVLQLAEQHWPVSARSQHSARQQLQSQAGGLGTLSPVPGPGGGKQTPLSLQTALQSPYPECSSLFLVLRISGEWGGVVYKEGRKRLSWAVVSGLLIVPTYITN